VRQNPLPFPRHPVSFRTLRCAGTPPVALFCTRQTSDYSAKPVPAIRVMAIAASGYQEPGWLLLRSIVSMSRHAGAPNPRKNFLRLLKPRLPQMLARCVSSWKPNRSALKSGRPTAAAASLLQHGAKNDVRTRAPKQNHRGDHLRIRIGPAKRACRPTPVLGHYEPVYSSGTLRKMPFPHLTAERPTPGYFRYEGRNRSGALRLHALQETNAELRKRLIFLWTSDERDRQ